MFILILTVNVYLYKNHLFTKTATLVFSQETLILRNNNIAFKANISFLVFCAETQYIQKTVPYNIISYFQMYGKTHSSHI